MAAPRKPTRAVIAVITAVLVVLAAFVAWRVTGNGSEGAAPCGAGTSLDAPIPKGDVRLSPFAADSPWRTPVATGELPAAATTSAETLALRDHADSSQEGAIVTWINAESYSMPIVQADPCDPIVTIDEKNPGQDISGVEIHIPTDAKPADGTDRHLMVIQPDHTTLIELWTAERVSDTHWRVGRVEVVDLTGSGIGPDNGVRAYGGSAIGGLIRNWEIDPSDPNYTDGVIRHPLAMAIPGTMLLYTGGDPGYDERGYGTALGYVAPATEQDYDSPWSYSGPIPMGSKVVLPRSVDLDSLDLTPEQRTIAQALQDYGAYVTDRVGDGTVAFYAEPTAPPAWLDSARGPHETGDGLSRIRAQLVVVP